MERLGVSRRKFLRLAAVSGAGLALAAAFPLPTKAKETEAVNRVSFPEDEGQHSTNVEWWYLNSHGLAGDSTAGFVATVRLGLPGPSQDFLIVGKTDLGAGSFQHNIYQGELTSATGGLDLTFRADNRVLFQMRREGDQSIPIFDYSFFVGTPELEIDPPLLSLFDFPLLEGGNGYVPIGPGIVSGYYSMTNLCVPEGRLRPGAWFDHQWFNSSSLQLSGFKPDHEWFSLQLEEGTDIVAWNIYEPAMGRAKFINMDILPARGEQVNLSDFRIEPREYWRAPDGKLLARQWRIQEASRGIDLVVRTKIDDQYLPRLGFYEGAARVEGSLGGRTVEGVGFVELTHSPKPYKSFVPVAQK